MDYIVNNTGIPTSEWWKYKPAGVNKGGPSLNFSSGPSGDNADVIDKLSNSSKAILKRLKTAPNAVSKREWMDLMSELNHMGAISDTDYTWSSPSFQMVPLGSDPEHPYETSQDMRTTLDRISQWNVNPLEYLDLWAFSLRKWGASLSLERSRDGTPLYRDLSPVYDQADACGRVSGLIKSLTAAVK